MALRGCCGRRGRLVGIMGVLMAIFGCAGWGKRRERALRELVVAGVIFYS